jgi:hypothetical protein
MAGMPSIRRKCTWRGDERSRAALGSESVQAEEVGAHEEDGGRQRTEGRHSHKCCAWELGAARIALTGDTVRG